MIICESPDISDAVSLVPSIANPRTAAHVEVAIMWVGSTRKCVYIPDATSINLSVAKSVLDPATSSLGGLSDALAFLRYPINEAHVGREFMITPDLLPWAPPRPIMCGCLFCNIRAHYGPIVFPIYGTTGDRNPIRAVARQLLKWGIDIIFLELQPLDVGIDDLERIHSGELLHLIPKYSGFKGLIASLPYITIGTPDLDAEISILLDPPPSALKEYDWRLGPILNPVISFLSGHMSTHPRIAAYPGWTHLPRSMDGHTFLEWSKVPREGRPDKVLWMIGSARVKIPVDAKQIIPGDHWPQLERAECVYTHGGAGSVQAAHCAGVSRIVVLDPMGDRGYKDLNNAGAGVSPGQDPDRALLLLLGHDFLPLILAYRSSFMLGLNALVWYLKLFAIPDLITVMTLFMISNEMGSFVLVPGSVVMTFVGSLAAMLFGRGVSIVLAIALQIWGMTLLRRLGVSPPAIAMKILRIGRLVGNSPYAALFWAAGYRRTAIVNLIIEKMGIPFYALCVKAYREPRGYIDFVYVAELSFLPMHTRFVSLDLKTVVEGGPLHDGPKGLYRLVRREYTTGDDDNLCIRFPILLDPLSINLQAQSIGEYILILHNCQTVMLASMDGAFMLMGPALLLMVPMFILAVVFGLTSLLTLGLFTLLIMVYLFTAGEDITPAMAFIKTVMNRYRALVLMARLKERESVWSQVLKSALAMAYSPGLTEEDRIAFDAAIRFNASVDAAIDTDHLLQTYATALQDLVNAIPGLADYAGSFGAFAGLSRLPIDLSVAAFVAQDMEEARNIDLLDRILNSAKVLTKVDVLEFENLKFEFEALDDLDAFIEARFQNPTLILLQDIFHAIAEHQVDTSFLVDFIELLPNVSNTFELLKDLFANHSSATCNEASERVQQILSSCQTRSDIFIRPFIFDDPLAQPIDPVYDPPLTQDEILKLAGQAAVGMAVGCDIHESIMQSIEMSADFLHDGSVPFCDAESAAYRDLSRYYETTKPIRDVFGFCLNGITWFRDFIVRRHHYTFSLMPLHAVFGFLGLLCSVSISFGARVGVAAIVTLCQMCGVDERIVYDIGGQIAFFIQMLDPAHRANPKPVWALLWKRKRANVSKGEALLFSIMPSTYVKSESYSDWVDQMAQLLTGSDVDVSKLWRVPPERAVYYPDQTYGLSEYLDLPISVQTHFTETVRERQLLEDSIAAGNGLAIDGAWLARPEHVTASIERYTVERPIVSFGAKAAISSAADALFEHYKELYDMPKPMTVADVMKNSKWKYAAGLPFMPYIRKRQTLQQTSWYDAIARAATKILETGRMPAVGLHGFPKAQVVSAERLIKDPSAMRTVTAGDRITAIAVNTLLMERNKRVGNIDAGLLNMMRRSEGSIVQIGRDIRRFPNIYSGDATRFDSTVVAEVATVGSVRLYQRGIESFGVYNSKAAVSVVHAYYEALTHGLIVNLIDGSVVWKTGGGGTGSAATTPDNRDWTRMVMIASWALTMGLPARDFFDHVKLTNASDDVFFSVDDQTDAKLQEWINTMKTEYGVRFAFTREENLNNILHLVKVPEEEVDREIYSVLGVDPPVDSLRVSPKRMLLMRSAYRSDRMKLNNAVAATYLADRSTGYQLLSAHSPDIYNLVTQDLIDAQLAYMSEHFATATAMVGRSESGLINDYHIDLGTQRPARSLVKAAKRAARRNPGRSDYEAHYIAEAQRKAKIWLRQRRGKSYRDVMSLWIKTPPPPSDGRSGRRWQRINAVASAIGPLSDLARLGVIKLSTISEIVPKALTSITPEIATLGVNRPFMTWDFTIEQYIWRREFSRIGKAPPISRLHELIRQSPYAAITDIAGFEALLRNETVLRALVAATTSNRTIRGSIWAVSNDAITGRVICILALYTTIDLIIRFMEQRLIFGVFIMAAFGIFRLLDVFYSLQSLAFWVCTGMASLAISNTVPRDKYILQKKLSVILAALVPGFVTDYWFGVFAALPYLAKIVELQAIVPWLILAANTEMSQKVLQQGTGSFDLALEFWVDNRFEMFLLGGVGSGKSTALPAALAHLYPRTQLVVLVPTNALVTNYVNDFLEDNRVLRVHREYPRDTKFVHNLVVMTYAQFWRRVGQLAINPIVLFDECHVASNDIFLAYQECKTMDVRCIYLTATFGGEFCAYLPHVVRYQQPDRVMPFIRSAPVVIPDTGNLNSDYVTAVRKAIADGAEPHSIMSYHPSIKTLRLWSTAFTGMGTPIRFITADHTDASSRSAVFVTGVVAMGANIRPPPKVLIYAPKILVPVHRYPIDDHGVITIKSGDLLNHISLVYVDMPAVDKHQLEGRVGREANGSIYIIGNAVGSPLPARINMSELSMLQQDCVDALLLQVPRYPGFLVRHDSDVFLGFFLVNRQNEQLASLGCAFAALVLSLGTFPAVFDCIAFAKHSTEHADALANSNFFLQQFGLAIPAVLNFWAGLAAFCQTCTLCLEHEQRANAIPIFANNGIVIYDLSLIATKLQVHERPFSARIALAGEVLSNLPKFALRDVSETLVSSITPAIYFDFDTPGVDQMITLLGGVAVITPIIIRLMQLHVRICEPRLIHFSCCPSELAMGNMYLCVGTYEQFFVVFDTDSNLLLISGLHHVRAQIHVSVATREVTMPLLLPHFCHQIFLDQEERSPSL
uniref:RNA-dependent RNA polymerase n=1 Tax=Lentinula eaodes hypovirus 2 TaxID=2992848 RepID=A0A9E8AE36_9VIRU|nr:RNA-dependent RNA polymerase [Lentinula eaodes hypovirus 2]